MLLAVTMVLLLPALLSADTVFLKDGRRLETQGRFTIESGMVKFVGVDDQTYAFPVDAVDLVRSLASRAKAKEQQGEAAATEEEPLPVAEAEPEPTEPKIEPSSQAVEVEQPERATEEQQPQAAEAEPQPEEPKIEPSTQAKETEQPEPAKDEPHPAVIQPEPQPEPTPSTPTAAPERERPQEAPGEAPPMKTSEPSPVRRSEPPAAESPQPPAAPTSAQQRPRRARKIWTNDDLEQLRSRAIVSVVGGARTSSAGEATEETEAAAPEVDAEAAAGEEAAPAPPKEQTREHWQERLQPLRAELARIEQQLQQLRRGRGQAASNAVDVMGGNPGVQVEDTIRQLERRRDQVQQQIADLQDEARRAGVPAGYVR
jgi:hypothetical protein